MWLALQGDRTQQQLNQHAVNVVKKRIETIDGVGEVRLNDVTEIVDGLSGYRRLARFNRKPTIGIGIVKVANTKHDD